jgi:vacuolar-type H+-ATPase subunit I/STV1
MDAVSIISKIFGVICMFIALIMGGIAYSAYQEQEEHYASAILSAGAILLFVVGLNFFQRIF